jgi:hypothetical protein
MDRRGEGMSDELDTTARVALVAAAAVQSGPGASDNVIEQQMGRLLRLASGRVMARVERILTETTFSAVILSVDLEQTSQRGLVKLRTEPSKRYPDGIEPIRTDPMWGGGRHLFDQAKALQGHNVLVHKAMEIKADGTDEKVRILIGLTHLGMPDGQQSVGAHAAVASQAAHYEPEYDPRPQPTPAPATAPAPSPAPKPFRPVDPDQIRGSFKGERTPEQAEWDRQVAAAAPNHPGVTTPRPGSPPSDLLPQVRLKPGEDPNGPPDRGALGGIATNLAAIGVSTDAERLEYVSALVGRDLASTAELTLYESRSVAQHVAQERAAAHRRPA